MQGRFGRGSGRIHAHELAALGALRLKPDHTVGRREQRVVLAAADVHAGMDPGAVLTATCLASAFATLLMALLANYPIAVAPAMGIQRTRV